MSSFFLFSFFFFFNDTATTEIYTLSLHDALPISCPLCPLGDFAGSRGHGLFVCLQHSRGTASPGSRAKHSAFDRNGDRKSTRLNSSHGYISYAVFCLKKKKKINLAHHDLSLGISI